MKKHIEQESNRVNNDNAEVTLKPTKKHRKIAARVVAQGMKDEAQANARLIAAAPELLEALKEAQKLLHPLVMKMKVKDHFHEHNVLANTIVKAIAKAEGRDVA